ARGFAPWVRHIMIERLSRTNVDLRLLAQSLQEEIGPFSETLPQTSEERQNAIGQAGEHRFLGVERCESRCDRRPGSAHAGGRHRTRTQGRLIWCEPRVCE